MEIIGYVLAILTGVVLGLIGGGGSILTVPVLVYVFQISPTLATAYSLFTVGTASAIAAWDYQKRGLIDFKVGALFAAPAFVGVYLVRRFVVPAMPEQVKVFGNLSMTKDTFILVVFAIVMLVAAIMMIRGRKEVKATEKKSPSPFLVTAEGLIVGGLTGFVGAGGGFMIIPALVLLAGLEMKMAIGTSLFIITIKSLFGFVGDIQSTAEISWNFLALLHFSPLLVLQ